MGALNWESPFPVHRDGSTAVLFVHGFMETPMSFTYLANQLEDALPVSQHATLLPGHGSNPRRLNDTNREDWYTAVRRDAESLSEQYRHLIVCGFSLGGLLAYALSHEVSLSGLVLLAPAFRYRFSAMKWGSDAAANVLPYLPQLGIDGLNDRTLDDYYAHYVFIPLRAVVQLNRLQEEVESKYAPSAVNCPTLTLQSTADWVIDYETTVAVARGLGHTGSRHRLFENSNHVLALDYDRKQVAEEIIDFVAGLTDVSR